MADPARYSDKRLKDSFTAYVLLSDPLQFHFPEIWAAVRQDYLGLAWAFTVEVAPPFDSATMSMGTHFGDTTAAAGARHGLINFLSTPDPLGIDTESLIQKSRFAFPDARHAIAAHRSVFSVSVGSVDDMIAARFDAARRMTCLTAIFAKLPTCLGDLLSQCGPDPCRRKPGSQRPIWRTRASSRRCNGSTTPWPR